MVTFCLAVEQNVKLALHDEIVYCALSEISWMNGVRYVQSLLPNFVESGISGGGVGSIVVAFVVVAVITINEHRYFELISLQESE
jgi:hypothetical protein